MTHEDGTIRISVVIHQSLDPEVYELLNSISIPRVRSEYARRLLRDGAIREYKSKNHGKPASVDLHSRNDKKAREVAPPARPTVAKPVAPPASARPHEDFVDDFVKGIIGVPSR